MDFIEIVDRSLTTAKDALADPAFDRLDNQNQVEVQYIQDQINNLITQLQAILADLQDGFSIFDLGYMGSGDFEEVIKVISDEIQMLKGAMRVLISLQR